jgi:uncharacterized membrane protein
LDAGTAPQAANQTIWLRSQNLETRGTWMDLRLALYELSAHRNLSAQQADRLEAVAGLRQAPEHLVRKVGLGMVILAAALGGFGVILWLAANWDTLGRFGHFSLLELAMLAMSLGAFYRPAWRAPLSLLALLCTGGLFAYFGQTYQTGADPWQLFAVWAALTLPLCLGTRSDVAWTPWALVVMTGISLWLHSHTDHRWRVEPTDLGVHLTAWGMALALSAALSPAFRRWTGAGAWSWRLGFLMAATTLTLTALGGLFDTEYSGMYGMALPLLCAAAGLLCQARYFDVFALSTAGLGINVLLVFGLGHWLFRGPHNNWMFGLLVLGLFAAGLLAGTVSVVLKCMRRDASQAAAPAGGQA